jgi:hypothetical protein
MLLPVWRHRGSRVRVRVHADARDQGLEPRGYGRALRQMKIDTCSPLKLVLLLMYPSLC